MHGDLGIYEWWLDTQTDRQTNFTTLYIYTPHCINIMGSIKKEGKNLPFGLLQLFNFLIDKYCLDATG